MTVKVTQSGRLTSSFWVVAAAVEDQLLSTALKEQALTAVAAALVQVVALPTAIAAALATHTWLAGMVECLAVEEALVNIPQVAVVVTAAAAAALAMPSTPIAPSTTAGAVTASFSSNTKSPSEEALTNEKVRTIL